MRDLTRAREEGRTLRRKLGIEPQGLYKRLCEYLWDTYKVEPKAVDPKKLQYGRAEVKPPNIFYDRCFDDDPLNRLRVIAHEAGHLIRHDRLHRLGTVPDATRSGTYLEHERAPAIARYSRKSGEEAEADAFALELVCPSDEAFRLWLSDPKSNSRTVAAAMGTTREVAKAQLVEGLYGYTMSGNLGNLVREIGLAKEDVLTSNQLQSGDVSAAHGHPGAEENTLNSQNVREQDHGFQSQDIPEQDPQELAIKHKAGAALVDAGPGCGKTYALIERAQWLILHDVRRSQERGDPISEKDAAEHILALTFSNEAAGEIRERLATKIGPDVADAVTAATFHGFCRHLLHLHGEPLGIPADAPMLDESAQEELILDAIGRSACDPILDLKDLDGTAAEIRRHIDYLKQRLTMSASGAELETWTPELLEKALNRIREEIETDVNGPDAPHHGAMEEYYAFFSVFAVYEEAKRQAGVLDFADLIALVISLLRQNPKIAEAYQKRFRHVLVDEFQDVSRSVSILLSLLCGPDNPPWVVGDQNQSIYRFLGAAPENVERFHETFPDAEVYRLKRNYRAAPEIVNATNELATLLADSTFVEGELEERFIAATDIVSLTAPAVKVAVAESDDAEVAGVVRQVEAWLELGVEPHNVAVLCRRNADVKRVVLALGDRGLRAVSSGVLTPEGAAGDLAAIVTIRDGGTASLRASLARLTYALGRGSWSFEEMNTIVERLFDLLDGVGEAEKGQHPIWDKSVSSEPPLLQEVVRVARLLAGETYAGDAFDILTAFLFDASTYLRAIINALDSTVGETSFDQTVASQLDEVVATLRISESLTTLSRAAAYRFGHPYKPEVGPDNLPQRRRRARLEFGAALRRALTDATPTANTPRRIEGAVQVMTCHASKGLEFQCVCVVGQTLGPDSKYLWIPQSLQPPDEQDKEQANALLFVGATRAQRAVTVSYAARRTPNGRKRTLTPLLERWVDVFGYKMNEWEEVNKEKEEAKEQRPSLTESDLIFGDVWGRRGSVRLRTSALDARSCGVKVYVRDIAGLRFPEAETPVYPLYFDALREMLRRIVVAVNERGAVSVEEANAIIERTWIEVAVRVPEHRHLQLFERLARRHIQAFARSYSNAIGNIFPRATSYRKLDLGLSEMIKNHTLRVRPGFVATFLCDDGSPVALILRTESYVQKLAANEGGILWSKLSTARRLPFVLLREHYPELLPLVFSTSDGAVYPFNWSTKSSSMQNEFNKAKTRLDEIASGSLIATVDPWSCDRCGSRLVCLHWLNQS